MAPRRTIVVSGWFICKEILENWSECEEKVNADYRKCLKREAGTGPLAVASYLRMKKLGRLVKLQYTLKPEHGGCGRHCWNHNIVFYRRFGGIPSMSKCRPADWKRFEQEDADFEIKQRLEDALHFQLSNWSTIVWGPTAMVYDASREMWETRGAELVEKLENGPVGPWGGNPPPRA
ncbi:hypothetical protein FRC07_005365 [Ceratobasidium sp. 392]|nr:hypothetical protein FRC07_005365 [Ceratobasidium sp. 392]